jgi:glycosyltransferase involved in cell wall biosynthesis
MPLVSVIVPNYNHELYLTQRIESILNQTFKDYELILLDDASTDSSLDILRRYSGSNIRLIENSSNSGSPFKQWNKGVKLATGKYIWIAESDDYCENTLLEKLVARMESSPDIHLAFAQTTLVNAQGKTINSFGENYRFLFKTSRWENNFVANGKDECRKYLMKYNTIPNASAAMMRRDTYLEVGGAPEDFKLNGDWMLYTKILLKGQFAFCADHLNFFRVHEQTQRNRARRQAHAFPEILQIQDTIIKNTEISPLEISDARKTVGEWWIGGLAHQTWFRKGFLSENRNLYKKFQPHFKFLWLRIIWHFAYASIWYVLYKTRLLPVLKKARHALFPGKYFEY